MTTSPASDFRPPPQNKTVKLLVPLGIVLVLAMVAIVAGVLSLGGLSGPSGPGAEATPPPKPADQFGPMDFGFAESVNDLDEVAKLAPDSSPIIRIMQDWYAIQGSPGDEFDFTRLDEKVNAVRDRGWRTLLVLSHPPQWANEHDPRFDEPGADPHTWFPADNDAWAKAVRRTVERYSATVKAYEVWNGPNNLALGKYGDNSTPSRRDRYWALTKIAYEQVHAACDTCLVIAGPSTAPSPDHPDDDPAAWLTWGYQNGYGKYFDALAFHPFPQPVPTTPACDRPYENLFGPLDDEQPCGGIAAMRKVMVQQGDSEKKIWATEWGLPFPSSDDPKLTEVATAFAGTVQLWRELSYAGPLILYTVVDSVSCNPGPCFGLVTRQRVPKEPQYTLVSQALRFIRPECGEREIQPVYVPSDHLEPGQCWRSTWPTDRLVSENGHVRLTLTADGQLVLTLGEATLWTSGPQRGAVLRNQVDGNVVLYDRVGNAVWDSGTHNNGPSTFQVSDDGSLVVRGHNGRPIWSSNTPSDGQLFRDSRDQIAVHAGGALIRFQDGQELTALGYELDSLLTVPDDWAASRPASPRNGTLVRTVSGRVGVVAGGAVLWFTGVEELNALYPGKATVGVPDTWLDKLESPADGTLVRAINDPQVWRLANGRRTAAVANGDDLVTLVGASALGQIPVS